MQMQSTLPRDCVQRWIKPTQPSSQQRRDILNHLAVTEDLVAVKITIKPNGPYRVEPADGIELYGADGSKFDLTGKPGISLCRCGGSVNKPFCDGTHSKIGFQGAESAVKK